MTTIFGFMLIGLFHFLRTLVVFSKLENPTAFKVLEEVYVCWSIDSVFPASSARAIDCSFFQEASQWQCESLVF